MKTKELLLWAHRKKSLQAREISLNDLLAFDTIQSMSFGDKLSCFIVRNSNLTVSLLSSNFIYQSSSMEKEGKKRTCLNRNNQIKDSNGSRLILLLHCKQEVCFRFS